MIRKVYVVTQIPVCAVTEVFCKKDVLKNFAKFTGQHLYQSLFFNKVAVLRPSTLLKKRPWHRCFPVNFVNFLRTPFYKEHVRWLLLNFSGKHQWRRLAIFRKASLINIYNTFIFLINTTE